MQWSPICRPLTGTFYGSQAKDNWAQNEDFKFNTTGLLKLQG